MKVSTLRKKSTLVLTLLLTFLLSAAGVSTANAEDFSEDFESVTITDANTWGYGTKLSNDWIIVSGQISGTANTAYSLGTTVDGTKIGKDSSKGLAALYSSSNSAFIVTNELSGTIQLNVANSGTAAGSIYVYEAIASDDTYTKGSTLLYSKTWAKNTSRRNPVWEDAEFEIGSTAKRLAIVMVKSCIDNFATAGSSEPVEQKANLNILQTSIPNSNSISLDETTNQVWIQVKNEGNIATENAVATLYVNNVANNTTNFSLDVNGSQYVYISYNKTTITDGTYPVYVAISADNDDTESTNVKKSGEVSVTFKTPVIDPTYSITADNVTVAYDATSYNVVAHVTNTNNVASENVEVKLLSGATELAKTTVDIPAGATVDATLTVVGGPFTAGTKEMQVVVGTVSKWIKVTVEETPIPDVYDLAITAIDGTIDLANESSQVRITANNKGNKDITDAPVTLKAGETTLGTSTITAAAGKEGAYCYVTVPSEGLTAGELNVTATVEVENDATPEDNTKEATLTVKAAPVPQPTFSVTAEENMNVEATAASFTITATVKNTSEVNATDVEVKLLKGITEVETKTITTLNAGEETTVDFTVEATTENPFTAGKNVTYYVQVASQAQAEVSVNFTEPVVPDVKDLEVYGIQGTIDQAQESNTVTVLVKNVGNVDIDAATITLKAGETTLGTGTLFNKVKAGTDENTGFSQITIAKEVTDALEATDALEVTATAVVEGEDADKLANNTFSTTIVVKAAPAPKAEVAINSISGWEVEAGEQTISISPVIVNNSTNVGAENVHVIVYKEISTTLAETTIEKITAGQNTYATLSFGYTFEQGHSYEFTVYTDYVDGNADDNMQKFTITCPAPKADLSLANIDAISATTEEDVKITAVVKNVSSVEATDVKVGVYTQDESFQYVLVGMQQTIESLAAGATESLEFNLGTLEAGSYTYYVRIVSEDANADNNLQDVTVKVTEPVVETIDLAITSISGTLSLETENNYLTVFVENKGTANATGATLTLSHGDQVLATETINVNAGSSAFKSIAVSADDLTAGEFEVTAKVEIEGDIDLTNNESTKTYTIAAPKPTVAISANYVTVAADEENVVITVTVENTGKVDANDIDIVLYSESSQIIETKTVSVAVGATETVTFTIDNPGVKDTYWYQVGYGSTMTWVKVTVTEATGIAAIKAQYGEDVEVYTISGTKVNEVRKGGLYIVNGKKIAIK